jgi:hypothetical protein
MSMNMVSKKRYATPEKFDVDGKGKICTAIF